MLQHKLLAELEKRFENLAMKMRRGWIKKHPLTDKERSIVRDAVRAQWSEQQKIKAQGKEKAPAQQPKKQARKKAVRERSKSKNRGHDFGHSH